MNHLIPFIFCSIILVGCCEPGSEPAPPYGNPDDVSRYDGSEGYKSIDYTYYCKNGKYISVTYIRKDNCSDYGKDSEYSSSGICGGAEISSAPLNGLSAQAKLKYLISKGYKIDTVRSSKSSSSDLLSP